MADIQRAIYMNKVRGLNTPSTSSGSVEGLEGETPPPVEQVPVATPPEAATDGSIPPPGDVTTADGNVVQDVTQSTDAPPPQSPYLDAVMRELSKHSGLDTTPIEEPPASETD